MNIVIQKDAHGDGLIVLPAELLQPLGLKPGDMLEAEVHSVEGHASLALQAHFCPGEITIVEDRYGGAYSDAVYVAWPLPAASVPAASQDGDIDAGVFWSEEHLCGKGDTPEAAKADLEEKCRTLPFKLGLRSG